MALALVISFGCGDDGSTGDETRDGGAGGADAAHAADASPADYDFVVCGRTTGPAPRVSGAVTAAPGEGQNSEYCGAGFPTLDLATNDPFSAVRQETPPDNLVPPFAACQEAYQTGMASRPSCASATASTLLVSKEGESDPRWQSGAFDGLYDKIQDAIDAATHCDTIIVRPGIYREYLSIEGKDVRIYSDSWNESASAQDGDERVSSYTAERIDLGHYYETGVRDVVETRQTYTKPLRRAVRTVLEDGGYAEGPTRGGEYDRELSPDDPNRGCGNRRPMVDFVAGTTRNTVFDGFTVRLMPEQDHTIPGHGHTLQCRGGSPIIRNNIVYNNGSTGAGVHANFVDTTPVTPPCEDHPELAQETFSNSDYRVSNVGYRPVPLVYGNISYQNNGLGLGNNHYSCAVMVGNESFWNAVPGEEAEHQSPGIGVRHGAKTCIDLNVVYENAWSGIGIRQGFLQPAAACTEDPVGCNHIDERTQAVVTRNIVFDNGSDAAPQSSLGGIAVDGVGLPDEPVLIRENISFRSRVSGIGVRNEMAGADRGFLLDDTYVEVMNNTSFANELQGFACLGSSYGASHCAVAGNESFWNRQAGIGFSGDARGSAVNNVAACNSQAGIQTLELEGAEEIAVYNNIAWANVGPGIANPGALQGFNLYSANNGQAPTCSDEPWGELCKKPQSGDAQGGTAGENELFVDPELNDAAHFDFGVSADSPAVDSGTDVSDYCPSRPVEGNAPDRGSHEQ